MTKEIWNRNQSLFSQQTGLEVKGNEQAYLLWLNATFTLECHNALAQIFNMVTNIRDTK